MPLSYKRSAGPGQDSYGVDGLGGDELDEVVGEGGVRVIEHAPVEGAPQVPVGGVEDPHADTVSQPTDINDGALWRSVAGFLVGVVLCAVLLVLLRVRRRLEELVRILESSCGAVGIGEVVACGQGEGVVGSQDMSRVFEGLLEQGDGIVESACCLVGASEVVA